MAVIVTQLFLAHELRGRDSNPYSRIQNPLSYHLNDPGLIALTAHRLANVSVLRRLRPGPKVPPSGDLCPSPRTRSR